MHIVLIGVNMAVPGWILDQRPPRPGLDKGGWGGQLLLPVMLTFGN